MSRYGTATYIPSLSIIGFNNSFESGFDQFKRLFAVRDFFLNKENWDLLNSIVKGDIPTMDHADRNEEKTR